MIRLLGILILFIFTISCNDYQKLLNSTENEVDKYTASEKYYDNALSLPLYQTLKDSEQEQVISLVKKFYG